MSADNAVERPKYACPHCGSTEVRGEFDSYPVFRAEENNLVYARSETIVSGLSELLCNVCHNFITDDLYDAEIE